MCFILIQYKPLSETESSQESDCGEGPSSQGEESDLRGDSSSQVTSQETGTEDEGNTATTGKSGKLFRSYIDLHVSWAVKHFWQ